MNDDDSSTWSDAVAEVQRRVAAGRADGRYPEELEDQLASQFARAAKDPLAFEGLDEFRRRLAELHAVRFGRDRIALSSAVVGGSQLHRVVGKVVTRQIAGVLQQVSSYATDLARVLDALSSGLDELRSVVTNDVFGDIDAVHHRLVEVEHRLARLEAAPGADPTDAA